MEENVSILRVDTGEAVQSVNDLKENIKLLKGQLGELTIGSDEYKKKLSELTINQNALKDAMHATSASIEDVAASAKGLNVEFDEQNKLINQGTISYNELVHKMAALKEQWRATADEAERSRLGEQINEINQQLKNMDASVGNFSRNVGNYESGMTPLVAKFDEWGETLKMFPPTLGAAKEKIGKVGETLQLVGKQPILGIVGLLAPIIMQITESLKDNETAMGAVDKMMASLQPVMDLFAGILEVVAKGLSKVVNWFVEMIGQSDGMKKVVSNVIGVGNSILQYLLTPIKSAIAGFKGLAKIVKDVFTGNFKDVKKHAKEAGQGIADAWKDGFSFKANFEEGKIAGANFLDGVKSQKAEAEQTGKEVGENVVKGFDDALKAGLAKRAEAYKQKLQEEADTNALFAEMWEENNAELEAFLDEEVELYRDALLKEKEMEKEKAKARIETLNAVASATSGLMSALADMYESDEKNTERNAKKVKRLRIASATIDMLQGAVTAFTSAQSLGVPMGQIVGAANAASVIAMGIANINKIKSTNVSAEGGDAPVTPAVVPAPNVETNLQTTRNLTSASEEERLNRMASSQKVYILQSDIEAAGHQSKVQVAESSF